MGCTITQTGLSGRRGTKLGSRGRRATYEVYKPSCGPGLLHRPVRRDRRYLGTTINVLVARAQLPSLL
jgi:hypothetical protein